MLLLFFVPVSVYPVYSIPVGDVCNPFERNLAFGEALTYEQRVARSLEKAIRTESQTLSLPFDAEEATSLRLTGRIRSISAKPSELRPYSHPRIVFGRSAWNDLLQHHSERYRGGNRNDWSTYLEHHTVIRGPLSKTISHLANLEKNGFTSDYDGRAVSQNEAYKSYRRKLKTLASSVHLMNSIHAPSFFLCAFWSGVDELETQPQIGHKAETCINAAVAWSKILLAHRAYHCNPVCPFAVHDPRRSFLWNVKIPWKMRNDDYTAGSSLALAYDVLYDKMSKSERRTIRSALALLVMNRFVWGICPISSKGCPDVFAEPHRIHNSKAMYHSNLFLTNLAIEAEAGFDNYAASVLREGRSNGFNYELHFRFLALMRAYMENGVYADGSTVEDGMAFVLGIREGSLALIAAYRRGLNLLDTARFRNLIHHSSQIIEPWGCGKLLGETSRATYNSFVALFNFLYPESEVVSVLWRQRMGSLKPRSCSRLPWRTVTQIVLLGRAPVLDTQNLDVLSRATEEVFPLNVLFPHRGLFVARAGLTSNHAVLWFDVRSDVALDGRSVGGRGDFTFAVNGRTWVKSFGTQSRERSILHIDGLAQEVIAPPAEIRHVDSEGANIVMVADLTYSYNVQWARGRKPQTRYNIVYDDLRMTSSRVAMRFLEEEVNLPPYNISVPAGVENRIWKRQLRKEAVRKVVRSVCVLQGSRNGTQSTSRGSSTGSLIISDFVDAGKGTHRIESYLALSKGTLVKNMSCSRNPSDPQCSVTLTDQKKKTNVVIHVHANVLLRVRREEVSNRTRIVVSCISRAPVRFWMAIAVAGVHALKMDLTKDGLFVTHGRDIDFLHATQDGGVRRPQAQEAQMLVTGKIVRLHPSLMTPVLQGKQTFEANFVLRAQSDHEKEDLISTCHHGTTVRTRINVFACDLGDCEEVHGLHHPCSPASGREEWSGNLQNGNTYHVKIAVESIEGLRSVVEVEHKVRPKSGRNLYRSNPGLQS